MNQGFLKVIVALKFLILAKFLGIELIGELSIILLIIAFSEAITEFGFNFSFVSKLKDPTKEQVNSLWTITIFRGSLAAIIILIFSTITLNIINKEHLLIPSYLAALVPFIRSLNNIYNLSCLRDRNFKKLFMWNSIYVLADIFLSTLIAFKYSEIIYILIAYISAELLKVLFSYVIFKEKPKFYFSFSLISDEIEYGKWTWKSSVITYFINQLDKFLVPIMLGTTVFGGYQSVYKVAQFGLSDFSQLISSILFPKLSQINRENLSPIKLLNKSLTLVSIFLCSVFLIFYSFREEIILYSIGKEFLKFSNLYLIFLIQMVLGVYTSIFVAYLRSINKPEKITSTIYVQFSIVCFGLVICYLLKLNFYYIASISMISLFLANIYFLKSIYLPYKK